MMIYNVTSEFVRINETSGTIQNVSYIYEIEFSNQAVANSGILIRPHERISFSGTPFYVRCPYPGSWAAIRVVPFFVEGGLNSGGTSAADTPLASDEEAENFLAAAWSGNYTTDPDADAVINDMWNSSTPIDTGDGFSDYVADSFAQG